MLDNVSKYLSYWWRQKTLPILIGAAIFAFIASALSDEAWADLTQMTRLSKFDIGLIGLAIIALLFGLSLIGRSRALPDDDFITINRFNEDDLLKLRDGLHFDLYGNEAPDHDEILAMYLINPTMGVGLYDKARKDFVAFTAAWPLREEIGELIRTGQMNESLIEAKHILPEREDSKARYILIPAFGVSRALAFRDRSHVAGRLEGALGFLIEQKYLTNKRRRIKLLATGYTELGENKCRRRAEMTSDHAVLMGGKTFSVYCREVCAADVREALLDGRR